MKSRWRTYAILEILVDQVLLAAGYALGVWLKFGTAIPEHNVTALRDTLPLAAVFGFILLAVYGVYADRYRPLRETFLNLAAAVGLLAIGVSALAFFLRGFAFPRSVLIMAPLIQLTLLSCWHGFNHLRRRKQRGVFRVLVIGDIPASAELLKKMERSVLGNQQLKMAGWVPMEAVNLEMSVESGFDGTVKSGFSAGFEAADGILLLAGVPDAARRILARNCAKTGKTLLCMPNPEDVLLAGAGVLQFGDVPVMVVEQSFRHQELQWLKRVLDVVFSLTALLATIPFVILAMLLVRLSGPGPVLFVQERVTLQGKVFRLVKFRTMVQHAETKTGPVLSVRNDPRVTPVGRFLRKSRLDELPQLWNILCGDMSLVGPRPERPMFVEQFEREMPGYHLRHAVRSGLTGLAQVYGNYATSAGDKLIFDLIYIRDWSLLMDLQIVLRTVTAVFRREASEGIALPEEEVRL